MIKRRAAFLDRDGVINIDRGYVSTKQDFEFVPGVFAGARALRSFGLLLVVITNQSGIARGYYSEADFLALTAWMERRFEEERAAIERTYFCPHHPEGDVIEYRKACGCRKPGPEMLLRAADDLSLDLARSVIFGDRLSDMEAGRAAGVRLRYLLATDGIGPIDNPAPGLVTCAFDRLTDAVADAGFIAAVREKNHI